MRRLIPGPVILTADDYGLAAGVSQGILELADASRISALSAIVTLPRWPEDAARLASVRAKVSVGLHLNLTLGRPLGAMPRLAPDGRLPAIGTLVRRAVMRDIDRGEIRAEVVRQLEAFERHAGCKPDHVDGHQHAHALPLVRGAVLDALETFYGKARPLVRDPGDRAISIATRGGEMAKAYGIAALAAGFRLQALWRGFPVNHGFSGFSAFDTSRLYEVELASAMRSTGLGHVLMCHPGYPDAELAGLDPVVERRMAELEALCINPEMPHRIWRPERRPGEPIVDWAWLERRGLMAYGR